MAAAAWSKMTLADAIKKRLIQNAVIKFLERIKRDKPMMNALLLTGWKTYILAALLILLGAAEFLGIDVPGFTMSPQEAFGLAIGFIFARNGAKTEVKKAITSETGL
jgi:hypothetical protein